MTLKKIITEAGRFIGRGFRYERFDVTALSNRDGAPVTDFCALVKVEPVGFEWKTLRMAVGGPVTASGTLELFTRRVRKEHSTRYTLNFAGAPTPERQSSVFGIPLATEKANVGIIGVYFTTADGLEHSYITRKAVTLTRGNVMVISVPKPAAESEKRDYVPPQVRVVGGEERQRIVDTMGGGEK